MSARFCYFVQSHRDPEQIVRLVAALRRGSPEAHIVVGHDGRGCALAPADLAAAGEVDLFAVEGPVERGRLSLLAPYLQAIERLRREGVRYDWLVYLSGQDYPTRPLAAAEREIAESGQDGFLRWWPAFGRDSAWSRRRQGYRRYAFHYRRAPRWAAPMLRLLRGINGVQPLVHFQLTYGPYVGVRRLRTPFRDGYVCWAGTQWTTLRRACVEELAATLARDTELVRYYAGTICPDESLVQTVLLNSRRFRFANDDLRYVDMRGTRTGSPRTLTSDDLPELVAGRHHFARKFDLAVDREVLDRLNAYLDLAPEPRLAKRSQST